MNILQYEFPQTEAQKQQAKNKHTHKAFAEQLIHYAQSIYMDQGIQPNQVVWMQHRLRAIEITFTPEIVAAIPYFASLEGMTCTMDIINMVITGDLETAYLILPLIAEDDMSKSHHIINDEFIYLLRTEIGKFLGYE